MKSICLTVPAFVVLFSWGPCLPWISAQNEDTPLARADKQCEAGKYTEALQAYEAILASNPDEAAAYTGAGKCLIGLNRIPDAVKMMETAVHRPEPVAGNYAVLGQAYYWDVTRIQATPNDSRAGYVAVILADAEHNLARAVEMDADLHVAHYYLGKVRMLLDKPAEAAPAFLEAGRKAPRKFKQYILGAFRDAAACYDRAGDARGALQAFQEGFRLDPSDTTIFLGIWTVYGAKKDRHADGVEILKALARSRSTAALPLYYLGFFYQAMDKKAEARAAFEKVVKTPEGQKFAPAWSTLGEIYYRDDKDEKKSERCLLKALDLNAADANAFKWLQFLAARAKEGGNLKRFLEINRAILKRQPENGQIWNQVAWYYHNRRQLKEAVPYYEKAMKFAPRDATIRCGAGKVMNDLGRDKEAEKCFLEAVALDPNYVDALMNLGWFYKRRGRTAEAITQFERVLKVDPQHMRAQRELAGLR